MKAFPRAPETDDEKQLTMDVQISARSQSFATLPMSSLIGFTQDRKKSFEVDRLLVC